MACSSRHAGVCECSTSLKQEQEVLERTGGWRYSFDGKTWNGEGTFSDWETLQLN